MKQNNLIKKYFSVFVVLALLGLGTCLLVEPALALAHHETECDSESEHCCFICNTSQHQWNFSNQAALINPPKVIIKVAAVKLNNYFYTSPHSIFRPPPVSLRI